MKLKGVLIFTCLALVLGSVKVAHATLCSVGDNAQVLWKGKWWPASVIDVNSSGTECKIHYTGYGASWDEWVGPKRIRVNGQGSMVTASPGSSAFGVGDKVSVKWGGKWWPAQVLKVNGNRLYIHYDGYGSKWDEWVGPARYRTP